jgi:hypothetical protein
MLSSSADNLMDNSAESAVSGLTSVRSCDCPGSRGRLLLSYGPVAQLSRLDTGTGARCGDCGVLSRHCEGMILWLCVCETRRFGSSTNWILKPNQPKYRWMVLDVRIKARCECLHQVKYPRLMVATLGANRSFFSARKVMGCKLS